MRDREDNIDYVSITRKYLDRNRSLAEHAVVINNLTFRVHSGVFSPLIFEDTAFFIHALENRHGDHFLEIGCGSGAIAVFGAIAGAKVVAVDINLQAVANTLHNAQLHGVENAICARHGDLFEPLRDGELFDAIFWNAPFQRDDCNLDDPLERSVFDPNYRSLYRYLAEGHRYLSTGGRLLLGFSSSSGVKSDLEDMVNSLGKKAILQSMTTLKDEDCCDFSLELYEIMLNEFRTE